MPRTLAGGFLRGDADGLQVLRDAVRKNPRAGHEDVRPRLRDDRRGVHLDPAIDLELRLEPLSVDVRPGLANLRHDVGTEGLTREARLDRHHEQEIRLAEEWRS